MFTIVSYKESEALPLGKFSFLLTPFIKNGKAAYVDGTLDDEACADRIMSLAKGKREWSLILIDGTSIYQTVNPYKPERNGGTKNGWCSLVKLVSEREEKIYEMEGFWRPPRTIDLISFYKESDQESPSSVEDGEVFDEGYSHNCRYLVHAMRPDSGRSKEQEIFNVFCAVLVLALNDLPHYVLEAYSLYRVDMEIDKDGFLSYSQNLRKRCLLIKQKIETQFDRLQAECAIRIQENSLSYSIKPPNLETFDKDLSIKAQQYAKYTRRREKDRETWPRDVNRINGMLPQYFREPENYLNRGLEEVKTILAGCHLEGNFCSEKELITYREKRDKLELELCGLGKDEDFSQKQFYREKEQKENKITDIIKGRLERWEDVRRAYIISTTIALFMWLPAWFGLLFFENAKFPTMMVLFMPALWNLLLVTFHFLITSIDLRGEIEEYNKILQKLSDFISLRCCRYERFLNKWIDYYRVLEILKRHEENDLQIKERELLLKRHQREVDVLEQTIVVLTGDSGAAEGIDLGFAGDFYIDFSREPCKNDAYEIPSSHFAKLELQHSGQELKSPFDFLRRMELKKEVLYE